MIEFPRCEKDTIFRRSGENRIWVRMTDSEAAGTEAQPVQDRHGVKIWSHTLPRTRLQIGFSIEVPAVLQWLPLNTEGTSHAVMAVCIATNKPCASEVLIAYNHLRLLRFAPPGSKKGNILISGRKMTYVEQ